MTDAKATIIAALIGGVFSLIVAIVSNTSRHKEQGNEDIGILVPSGWKHHKVSKYSSKNIYLWVSIGIFVGGSIGYIVSSSTTKEKESHLPQYSYPFANAHEPLPYEVYIPENLTPEFLDVNIKQILFGSLNSVVNITSLPGKKFYEHNTEEPARENLYYLSYNVVDFAHKTLVRVNDNNIVVAMYSSHPTTITYEHLVANYESKLGSAMAYYEDKDSRIAVWQDLETQLVIIEFSAGWVQTEILERSLSK
jgi:hypothetical protein